MKPTIVQVAPTELVSLPTANPNVMEPHVFEKLCKAIEKHGFLQPILVVEENEKFVVVDGEHRKRAALKLGLKSISAVVAADRDQAELLRIGMNKMRGELNLSEVGTQLQMLLDTGFEMKDLELTGFADWEVSALLDTMANDSDDESVLTGTDVSEPKPAKEKTYNLTFKFTSESDRAFVNEALRETGLPHNTEQIIAIIEQLKGLNYGEEPQYNDK